MKSLFDTVSMECSKNITQRYSTSFSLGIKFLGKEIRNPIYGIYGFVRLADEIVDSFHGYRQGVMLQSLKEDTAHAIENKISINPVLNSFQQVVHQYHIDQDLIDAFLESMAMDLKKQVYTKTLYEKYIYGSAEVVGLMCLKVFCKGDEAQYNQLKPAAMKLGSAFQKINFLRDIKADYEGLGRVYFPNTNFEQFNAYEKQRIEEDIAADFQEGLKGIKRLPRESKMGVYLAYMYYMMLFRKIKAVPVDQIMQVRIRIPDFQKIYLMFYSYFLGKLNWIR